MTLLKPAQKHGKLFLNPVPTQMFSLRTILKVLPLFLMGREESRAEAAAGTLHRRMPVSYSTPPVSGLRVTWFGHSSSLIEIDGLARAGGPRVGPAGQSLSLVMAPSGSFRRRSRWRTCRAWMSC
jgi:hypothetical protein